MKSLVRKLWVLPLFGLIFFWGVSMIGMPSNASASGNSLIAASKISANMKNRSNVNEDKVSISATVTRFKEHDQLVINDGSEEIIVEYTDKHKPLNLRVGDAVTVKGEFAEDRNGKRVIQAQEIWSNSRKVYPQPDLATRIHPNQSQTRYAYNRGEAARPASNGNAKKIADIKRNGRTGQFVTIEGEIIDIPDEEMIILKDDSGEEILIDIDDAQKTLRLKKGDHLNVQGNVTKGINGKKELEATRIEKKTDR
jgi:uncharacterized protein YdeI (BOF family)